MRNFLNRSLPLILIIFICSRCKKKNAFPQIKNLKEYKETTFLPTLETTFSTSKNRIYAASLLMAWNEIKNEVSEPIKRFSSKELELINNSDSYKNILLDTEYTSSISIEDSIVKAKAYFKKLLPFVIPFEKDKESLTFINDKIMSFGFYGENKASKILYYNNDNDFAIELFPKDNEHAIVLMKSNFLKILTLKDVIKNLSKHKNNFEKNRNDKNDWKYDFNNEDQVRIPIIEFNIETNYSKIEGSNFSTDKQNFLIELAYQRTAFVLNEKGAKVESESKIAYAKEAIEEEELSKPKKMIFDTPYLIFLKRKDSNYPYFAMFVSNSELMQKK